MKIVKTNYSGRPMDEHRTYSFLKALDDIQNKRNKSAVDLGCGHCKFTDIASVFFKKVCSVDSRDVRVPKILPENVTFIKENAVTHDISNYDVVICLGLLYHLTAKEQITILKKAIGKEVIIDTHMAIGSKEEISEGYKGNYYKEGETMEQMLKNPKASSTTLKSFWFNESEFERMLIDIGFKSITKYTPEHFKLRTFYLVK